MEACQFTNGNGEPCEALQTNGKQCYGHTCRRCDNPVFGIGHAFCVNHKCRKATCIEYVSEEEAEEYCREHEERE